MIEQAVIAPGGSAEEALDRHHRERRRSRSLSEATKRPLARVSELPVVEVRSGVVTPALSASISPEEAMGLHQQQRREQRRSFEQGVLSKLVALPENEHGLPEDSCTSTSPQRGPSPAQHEPSTSPGSKPPDGGPEEEATLDLSASGSRVLVAVRPIGSDTVELTISLPASVPALTPPSVPPLRCLSSRGEGGEGASPTLHLPLPLIYSNPTSPRLVPSDGLSGSEKEQQILAERQTLEHAAKTAAQLASEAARANAEWESATSMAAKVSQGASQWGPGSVNGSPSRHPGRGSGGSRAGWTMAQVAMEQAHRDASAAAAGAAAAAAHAEARADQAAKETPWAAGYLLVNEPFLGSGGGKGGGEMSIQRFGREKDAHKASRRLWSCWVLYREKGESYEEVSKGGMGFSHDTIRGYVTEKLAAMKREARQQSHIRSDTDEQPPPMGGPDQGTRESTGGAEGSTAPSPTQRPETTRLLAALDWQRNDS